MRSNYTRAAIQEWAESFTNIPQQTSALQTKVASERQQLAQSQQNLQTFNAETYEPQKERLHKLKAKIDLLNVPAEIEQIKAEIPRLERELQALEAPIKELHDKIKAAKSEIAHLNDLKKIKTAQSEMARLDREIEPLGLSDSQITVELASLRREQDSLLNALRAKELALASLDAEIASLRRQQATSVVVSAPVMNMPFPSPVVVTTNGGSAVSGMVIGSNNVNVVTQTDVNYSVPVVAVETAFIDPFAESIRRLEATRHNQAAIIEADGAHYRALVERIKELVRQSSRISNSINDINSRRQAHFRNYQSYDGVLIQEADRCQLSDLEDNLSNKDSTLLGLNVQLSKLTEKQSDLRLNIRQNDGTKASLEARLRECQQLVVGFDAPDDLTQLTSLHEISKKLVDACKTKQRELSDAVKESERKIQSDSYDISSLSNQLRANQNNEFLTKYRDEPHLLVKELIQKLQRTLADYEISHAYHQPFAVRRCLMQIAQTGFVPSGPVQLATIEDKVSYQNNYFLLCGLIEYTTKACAAEFRDLRVNLGVDLKEAEQDFIKIMNTPPQQSLDYTAHDVAVYELQMFNEAKTRLEQLLAPIDGRLPALAKVKKLSADMLADIDKKKTAEGDDFDYKYYTNLMNLTSQLITKPNDAAVQIAYRRHAGQHPDETPSRGWKAGGIIMMVFGAIVTAAAALVAIFGFPVGTPLYVSLPLAGAGLLTIGVGIGLFKRGSNKGMSGILHDIDTKIDKHKNAIAQHFAVTQPLLNAPGSYNAEPSAPPVEPKKTMM